MRPNLLAGIGLGLVAAVVFASATTGALLARFLLFFVTPLPIALAGLGWGWQAGVLAGLSGSALVLVFSGPAVAIAFAATQAAPIAVLTYLALLARPVADAKSAVEAVEWYPAGRLVIWSAAMAGVLAIGTLFLLGGDLDDLRKTLGEFVEKTVAASLPEGSEPIKLSDAEIASLSELALTALPAASALSWMASHLFNFWLAGRITLASGQLGRPWPDLAAIEYPRGVPLVFGLLLLATMIVGYPGLAASAFAGGLFAAYVLLGLAIVHFTTRGNGWRPFVLWTLYGALIVFNIWIAIVMAMLGLAETALRLRARVAPPSGPLPKTPPT
jgi:hypothetical protein